MNEINFLPPSFYGRQAQQRRVYREVLLVAVVAMGLLGWYGQRARGIAAMREQAQALVAEAQASAQSVKHIQKLETERKQLVHQVGIRRELTQSVSHTAVIASIAQLLPDQLTVSDLSVHTRRPAPVKVEEVRAAAAAAKSKRPGRRPAADTRRANQPDSLRIELVGVAPSDLQIANFVGRLSEHPLFTNVKMVYSRSIDVRGNEAREFELEMEVPLDRQYVPADKPAGKGGIAHAD